MLPLGGLLVAIFVGWRISRQATLEELGMADGTIYRTWRVLVQVVAPVGVLLIFGNALQAFLKDIGVLG
jgi:NSS family neurotransmitter:Na+ symporter